MHPTRRLASRMSLCSTPIRPVFSHEYGSTTAQEQAPEGVVLSAFNSEYRRSVPYRALAKYEIDGRCIVPFGFDRHDIGNTKDHYNLSAGLWR